METIISYSINITRVASHKLSLILFAPGGRTVYGIYMIVT
jgi:hypothetical protein